MVDRDGDLHEFPPPLRRRGFLKARYDAIRRNSRDVSLRVHMIRTFFRIDEHFPTHYKITGGRGPLIEGEPTNRLERYSLASVGGK